MRGLGGFTGAILWQQKKNPIRNVQDQALERTHRSRVKLSRVFGERGNSYCHMCFKAHWACILLFRRLGRKVRCQKTSQKRWSEKRLTYIQELSSEGFWILVFKGSLRLTFGSVSFAGLHNYEVCRNFFLLMLLLRIFFFFCATFWGQVDAMWCQWGSEHEVWSMCDLVSDLVLCLSPSNSTCRRHKHFWWVCSYFLHQWNHVWNSVPALKLVWSGASILCGPSTPSELLLLTTPFPVLKSSFGSKDFNRTLTEGQRTKSTQAGPNLKELLPKVTSSRMPSRRIPDAL